MNWKKTSIQSCQEMIKSMPWVYQDEAGFTAVFQFEVTGDENFQCYLEIKNGSCQYYDGVHDSPSLKIMTPAKVWLDISNGKLSGAKGLMTGKYKVKGNMLLLLKLDKLFPR